MPRTLHIIGLSKDGKSSLVAGPEKPIAETRALFAAIRSGEQFPKGLDQVHLYDSEDGRIGIAYDEKARRAAAIAESVKADKAHLAKLDEALKRAQARAKEIEGKTTPEVSHVKKAISDLEAQIEHLNKKIETNK